MVCCKIITKSQTGETGDFELLVLKKDLISDNINGLNLV